MKLSNRKNSLISALCFGAVLTFGASGVLAQTDTSAPSQTAVTQTINVQSGQRMKVRGVVVDRMGETFTVRDERGVDIPVRVTDSTSVRTKGGFLKSGKTFASEAIVRGLNVELEGVGDGSAVVANKIRFTNDDLRLARTIDTRVNPVEGRVASAEDRLAASEQNAQRLSGQIDELLAVSNAARGGAKAAQDTADAAVAGVAATNQRIAALDDYEVQTTATVLFKVGSTTLTQQGKADLDAAAQAALQAKGYMVEVTGFADSTGNTQANRRLSQRRAENVIQYLVETHNIPLRRILTPYGFGEGGAVADNRTRDGRAQNRRVEVKVLVNSGLNQNVTIEAAQPDESSSNQ